MVAVDDGDDGDPRRMLILVLVLLGQFIISASQASVTIATSTIRADLGATADDIQWLVVLYQIGYALILATAGRLGDIFGRKNLFLIGLTGFVAASVVSASAGSMPVLIVARLVQGVTGGLATPQVLAMIHVAFPAKERTRAFAKFSMISGGGFVIGQVITGLLVDWNLFNISWRNAFWLNVLIGVVVIVLSVRFLRPVARVPDQRIDAAGALMLAAASLLVLYPIIQGRSEGWPAIFFAMMAATAPVVWLMLRHFKRLTAAGRAPLIDTEVIGLRSFRAGLIVSALFGLLTFAPFFLITITLTQGFDQSPLKTALITSLAPMSNATVSTFSPRIIRRLGARVFVLAGLISMLAIVLLAGALIVGPQPPNLLMLAPGFICMGSLFGLAMPATVTLTLSQVPTSKSATASGMFQTAQTYITPMGVAFFSVVYFGVLGTATDGDSYIRATAWALVPALACSIPMILTGLFIARRNLFPETQPG